VIRLERGRGRKKGKKLPPGPSVYMRQKAGILKKTTTLVQKSTNGCHGNLRMNHQPIKKKAKTRGEHGRNTTAEGHESQERETSEFKDSSSGRGKNSTQCRRAVPATLRGRGPKKGEGQTNFQGGERTALLHREKKNEGLPPMETRHEPPTEANVERDENRKDHVKKKKAV